MDTIKLKLPAQAHLRLLPLYKRPQGTVREAVKGQTESMIFSSGGNQKQARRKQRKQSPPPLPPPQQQQRRLSQTLPEQKAKLYIIYRCIVMLLCCHD